MPGAGFFSDLFSKAGLGAGLVLGAAGLAAAKALKTAALGGLFAYLAPELSEKGGEKIIGLMKSVGIPMEWYDNLPQGMKDKIETGIGGIAGAIVAQIVLAFTAKKGLGLLVGLGALITKKVFNAIADAGKAAVGGAGNGAGKAAAGATRAAATRRLMSQADEAFQPLPPKVTSPLRQATEKFGASELMRRAEEGIQSGKFKNLDEAVEALAKSGKAAKYGRLIQFMAGLAKLAPTAAIAADFIEPAWAIYTDQPADVVKKELVGAFGSLSGGTLGAIAGAGVVSMAAGPAAATGIPGLLGGMVGGVAGALSGEYTAEAIAKFLMGFGDDLKPVNKQKTSALQREDVRDTRFETGSLPAYGMGSFADLGVGEMNPFGTGNVFTNNPGYEIPEPAPSVKVVPKSYGYVNKMTEAIMQMDYSKQEAEASAGSYGGAAPVIAPQNTTINNSQSQGFILPMPANVDLMDGGMATGMANYLKYGFGG